MKELELAAIHVFSCYTIMRAGDYGETEYHPFDS